MEELTETTPQVKQLMVKQAATQIQPYPPSGGTGLAWQRTPFDWPLCRILSTAISDAMCKQGHSSIEYYPWAMFWQDRMPFRVALLTKIRDVTGSLGEMSLVLGRNVRRYKVEWPALMHSIAERLISS